MILITIALFICEIFIAEPIGHLIYAGIFAKYGPKSKFTRCISILFLVDTHPRLLYDFVEDFANKACQYDNRILDVLNPEFAFSIEVIKKFM